MPDHIKFPFYTAKHLLFYPIKIWFPEENKIEIISKNSNFEFTGYDFYIKKNIHRIILNPLKIPFNKFKMKAKLELFKRQLAMFAWIVCKEGI